MSASRGLRRLPKQSPLSNAVVSSQIPQYQIIRRLTLKPSSRSQSRIGYRSFSTSHRRNDQQEHQQDVEEDIDIILEDELLAVQNKAIAELEAKLGKSLERAVIEDRLAEHLGLDDVEEEYEEVEEEDLTDALQELRDGGASPTDIAMNARNIYGDYLPEDSLTPDELILYKRLYGEPLAPESEVEVVEDEEADQNALFDAEGQEVEYALEDEAEITEDMLQQAEESTLSAYHPPMDLDEAGRAAEVAKTLGGFLVEDEGDYEFEDEDQEFSLDDQERGDRAHPLTTLGRSRTYPRTTFMPKETFVKPIQEILRYASNKHLRETAARTFGGPTLPDSAMTPVGSKTRKQVPIPLEAGQRGMGPMEANVFLSTLMPLVYASVQATLVETRKRLGASWLNKLLAKEGGPRVLDAGGAGAAALAWNDIVKAHWDTLHSSDKDPPPPPPSKMVVLTGSDALRHQSMKLLDNTTFIPRLPDLASTRDKPTLDDDRAPQARKQFDVIISSHSLFAFREEWERKQYIQNMWSLLSDDGGVLIMIEKGIPRGFETIAAARDLLLDRYISTPEQQSNHYSETSEEDELTKSPGMIIAPCTNHEQCPLYKVSGVSKGRRDICSFSQRYIRPPFLQNILQAKDRNHDDVHYSYLSVMKGDDLRTRTFSTFEQVADPISAPHAQTARDAARQQNRRRHVEQGFEEMDYDGDGRPPPPQHVLARVMKAPLKRQGHVILDVCTPQAEIRRWTIPKSFSRQAYRDARKSRWGDLWALGTKVNIARNLSLGSPLKDVQMEKILTADGLKPAKTLKPLTRAERLELRNEQIAEKKQTRAEENEDDRAEALFQKMIEEDDLFDAEDGDEDFDEAEMEQFQKKKKVNHAKLDGVNLAPPRKKKEKKPRTPKDEQKTASDRQRRLHPRMMDRQDFEDMPVDIDRMGSDNPLLDWSADLDAKLLDEQARAGVAKTGRRPSAKNTYRFKRDLRRARQRLGAEGGDV